MGCGHYPCFVNEQRFFFVLTISHPFFYLAQSHTYNKIPKARPPFKMMCHVYYPLKAEKAILSFLNEVFSKHAIFSV